VPLREVSPDEIGFLTPILDAAFGGVVVVGPGIAIPRDAYDPSRGQYRSTALLDHLTRAKRPEWNRALGVANVDLFVPGLNFVFGRGRPTARGRRHVGMAHGWGTAMELLGANALPLGTQPERP
jgi:archaemetzincin